MVGIPATHRAELDLFALYLFVICYASLFCTSSPTLLFPREMDDYDGYRDYFLSRRKWLFGILALTYLADVADTLIKGQAATSTQLRLGSIPVRITAYVALLRPRRDVLPATPGSTRVFVAASLVYQVSFITCGSTTAGG